MPRDPSSAAFPVCAALIVPGSDVLVPNIGLNPTRAGLFATLREMGADLTYENAREEGGEPVADLRARFSPDLKGIEVDPARAASMIDEYPVLSVVAAFAEGPQSCAAWPNCVSRNPTVSRRWHRPARERGQGRGRRGLVDRPWARAWRRSGGATCASHLDHRIAMSFLILGMAADAPVTVDDGGPIATSFPIFEPLMHSLGARITKDF